MQDVETVMMLDLEQAVTLVVEEEEAAAEVAEAWEEVDLTKVVEDLIKVEEVLTKVVEEAEAWEAEASVPAEEAEWVAVVDILVKAVAVVEVLIKVA